jgi:hypothetical protein
VATTARDLRRAPRRPGSHRPHLRVVDPKARRRAGRPGTRLAAGLCALFLVLFGNAVAHSMLVSGQERLDGLTARVEEEQARNQRLHLRAASLESPERIVEAAKRAGMIPADHIEWLAPTPGEGRSGGSGAETEELASGDGADTAGR